MIPKFEFALGTFKDAEKWCDKLEDLIESTLAKIPFEEGQTLGDIFMPKFHHRDGKIIVGM